MLQSNGKNAKETLNALLVERLNKYLKKKLTDDLCLRIYQEIFLTLQEIVVEIPTIRKKITHDAMNYISQAYYDMIELNNSKRLNPEIFNARPQANDLSNEDLMFCSMFLQGTDVMAEIVAVLKKRS